LGDVSLKRAEFPEKLSVLFQPAPYKVLHGGRGGAKTWGICRALLILGARKALTILCAREFQNSIEDSVYKNLCQQIPILGLEGHYEIQATKIFGRPGTTAEGTEFSFSGLRRNVKSIKSREGVDILFVEEAVDVSKTTWDTVVPTFRKDPPYGPFGQGSEIWISFNPELETDETYARFVKNPPPGAVVVPINWRDNPWFPEKLRILKDTARENDPDGYLNIWEGHCRNSLDAAVYANELRKAQEEGRICNVPYREGIPVSVFADLGYADFTSLWFVQKVGMNVHVIDFHQDQFQFWPHYLKLLQEKRYYYDKIWLPHDGSHKDISQVEADKTVLGQTRAAGLKAVTVPNVTVADGINAVRTVFPSLYFDEKKCGDGLNHIRRYRYKIKDAGSAEQSHSREPVHDDASHAADALRYLAVGFKEGAKERKSKLPPPRTSSVSGMSQGWMS
jgi:phage terminase large subunit